MLRAAFDEHASLPNGDDDPAAVDIAGLLAVLRAVGLVHELVASEVEKFVRAEFAADVKMPYAPDGVEGAFEKVIAFEHGHDLSSEERAKRCPKANEIVDESTGCLLYTSPSPRD